MQMHKKHRAVDEESSFLVSQRSPMRFLASYSEVKDYGIDYPVNGVGGLIILWMGYFTIQLEVGVTVDQDMERSEADA